MNSFDRMCYIDLDGELSAHRSDMTFIRNVAVKYGKYKSLVYSHLFSTEGNTMHVLAPEVRMVQLCMHEAENKLVNPSLL